MTTIESIFEMHYGEYFDIVGKETVDKISKSVQNETELYNFTSESGSNVDFTSVITIITTIISVIEITLKIKEHREQNSSTQIVDIEIDDSIKQLILDQLNKSKLNLVEEKEEKIRIVNDVVLKIKSKT